MDKSANYNIMKIASDNKGLDPMKVFVFMGLLMIASIRGMLIINFHLPAKDVYMASSLGLISFSIYGYLKSLNKNQIIPLSLSKLLHIHLFLGIVYIWFNFLFQVIFSIPYDFSSSVNAMYIFIAPFTIYSFTELSKRNLQIAFAVIAIIIGYSVINERIILLQGEAGIKKVLEYRNILRPGTQALFRIGNYMLPGGYLASNHDAANLLGILCVFFITRTIIKLRSFDICLGVITFISLHLTASASNIVVFYFCIFCIVGYFFFIGRKLKYLIVLLILVCLSILAFIKFGEHFSVFLKKFGANSGQENMLKGINNSETIFSSIPFLLIGHASDFGHPIIKTEAALLKITFDLGIFPSLLLFYIMLYPIILWRKNGLKINALPSIAAVGFSFLTLLHYGSLFRITSVFLFFAMYSFSIKEIVSKDEEYLKL